MMAETPVAPEPLAEPETRLASFVLRFVCDPPGAGPVAGWRGVLRHIQSDTEIHFNRWEEAEAFISRHVRLRPES